MDESLQKIAEQLVTPKKGILAADESNSTAGKRLQSIGVNSSAETRRQYRNLFLNTSGIEEYLSGVILFTETLGQESDDGVLFPDLLKQKGILPGVKVDLGTKPLAGFPHEEVTEGLDGLAERLAQYKPSGCVFTKWRAVIRINDDIPTPEAIHTNAITLARYARVAQDAGYVPIVEPEVLYAGEHSFQRAEEVTSQVLSEVCYQLNRYRADLEATIIKTSMVLPGKDSGEEVSDEEVARATARVLRESVSEEIAGIVFLSGGQEPDEATKHLNAIAELEPFSWEVAFSYARAIQQPVLDVWEGKDENIEAAREEFVRRLKLNTQADMGKLDQVNGE